MTVTEAHLNPGRESGGFLPKHVRGLLLGEWLAARGLILGLVALYLVFGWVLLIFFHPGFILAFGALAAVLVAGKLAGSDAAEGSEEFSFSLPPTRAERYLARLALGLAVVLGLTLVGALSIALNLPQLVWSIFVETGFTEPFPRVEDRVVYPLAVAIPLAAFGFTFLLAAMARTRSGAGAAWVLGALAAGAALLAGAIIEWWAWDEFTGLVTLPWLFALAVAAPAAGWALYRRKEGIARPTSVEARGRAGWTVVAVVVGLLLLFFLFLMAGRHASRPVGTQPNETIHAPATGR